MSGCQDSTGERHWLPTQPACCDRSFRPVPLRERRRNGTGAARPGGVAFLTVPSLGSTAVSARSLLLLLLLLPCLCCLFVADLLCWLLLPSQQ